MIKKGKIEKKIKKKQKRESNSDNLVEFTFTDVLLIKKQKKLNNCEKFLIFFFEPQLY